MAQHDGGWRTTDSKFLFESKWFNLRQDRVELPSGNEITYTLVDHPGFVVVVPLLPHGDLLLERIFRYTVQETLIECPAGGLDGQLPETAARRELREETGFEAGELRSLGRFYGSTGMSNQEFHVLLATDLRDTGSVDREQTEQMEVVRISLTEAAALARSGGVVNGPSALAILLAEGYVASA